MREQRHPDDTLRWVRRGSVLAALLIGWMFILVMNHFHITPPVVFVCLGYFAAIAAIYTLYRTGATAVSANDEIDDPGSWGRPIGELSELEREKRTLLKAIKEAEFDHQMGKLSKADADGMIAIYRARAIEVIKEIDVLDSTSGKTGTVRDKILREARARIEVEDKSTGAATKPGKKKDKGSEKQKARADKLADAVETAKSSKADDSKADDSDSKTDAANESKADSKADAAKVEAKADDPSGDAADNAAAKGDETDAKSETKADAVSDKTADKTGAKYDPDKADADKTDAKPDTDKADVKTDAAAQKAKPEASDNPAASVDSDATDKAESKEAAR